MNTLFVCLIWGLVTSAILHAHMDACFKLHVIKNLSPLRIQGTTKGDASSMS